METGIDSIPKIDRSGSAEKPSRETGNPVIRRDIAKVGRETYALRENDKSLGKVLEDKADFQGTLVLIHQRDKDSDQLIAKHMQGENAQRYLEAIKSDILIEKAIETSKRKIGKRKIPIGHHALSKKHGHSISVYGLGITRFTELTDHNKCTQQLAEKYIRSIMENPGTIIVNGISVRVLNELGQGVNLWTTDLLGEVNRVNANFFAGFLDSDHYFKPHKKSTVEKSA